MAPQRAGLSGDMSSRLTIFLDDGGVINDNAVRGPQWQRLVGRFLSPRLGGEPEAWAQANKVVAERIWSRSGPYVDLLPFSPNPPEDTDGRREDSGRGWVRELQGRWPGVLGVDGRPADGLQSPHRALRPYAGVAMRGMARGYAAGDSRDRGGARLRGRWVSCRLAVRPGTEWLAAGPRRD